MNKVYYIVQDYPNFLKLVKELSDIYLYLGNMGILRGILKKNNSPRNKDRTVTFGRDTIYPIPNRLTLVRTGELEKIKINGITIRHEDFKKEYKNVGRFQIKKKIKAIGRFIVS